MKAAFYGDKELIQPQVNARPVNSHTEAPESVKTNAMVVPIIKMLRHSNGCQVCGDTQMLPIADDRRVRVYFIHSHGGFDVFEGRAIDCKLPEWFKNYSPLNHPPSHAAGREWAKAVGAKLMGPAPA
jgi:hypothetical protein